MQNAQRPLSLNLNILKTKTQPTSVFLQGCEDCVRPSLFIAYARVILKENRWMISTTFSCAVILSVDISNVHCIYMEQHSLIHYEFCEKKAYDQEKIAFLEAVASTESQMWVISSTDWAEEAKFMMNKLDIADQIEIAEISIFFLGEEPLLSVFKITELAANALTEKSALKSLGIGIASGLAGIGWPQPQHPHAAHPCSCSGAALRGHLAPHQPHS